MRIIDKKEWLIRIKTGDISTIDLLNYLFVKYVLAKK